MVARSATGGGKKDGTREIERDTSMDKKHPKFGIRDEHYLPKIGKRKCNICHETFDIQAKTDRFCPNCKNTELYKYDYSHALTNVR